MFKTDNTDYMYVVEKNPLTSMPTIVFFAPVTAAETPRCRITLDYVEVMHDEGGLDYVTIVACLMAVYFVYNIQYAPKINTTLKFIQYHLVHMNEKDAKMTTKRVANLLFR